MDNHNYTGIVFGTHLSYSTIALVITSNPGIVA
jgi:hypothetical protein